jgi:hypothetical protein
MKLNTPSQIVFHFQQLLEGVIMKLKKQNYVSGKEIASHLVHVVLAPILLNLKHNVFLFCSKQSLFNDTVRDL